MEESFGISEELLGDLPTLAVRGEVDVATAPELRDRLLGVAKQGHTSVVVDLGEVTFLDSTALGVLVSGLKRFRSAGGELRLVVTDERVAKVLEITGLVEVFPIFDSRDAAVAG